MYRRVTVHICRVVIGCNASTRPRDPSENVYETAGFRGCHSFSDIDMANVMLNHPEYCHYKPVSGMQNTSNESDEATSHPVERVPVATASGKDSETVHVVSICQWHISISIFRVNKFGKREYKY